MERLRDHEHQLLPDSKGIIWELREILSNEQSRYEQALFNEKRHLEDLEQSMQGQFMSSRLRQGYRLRFSSQSPRISHLCLWVHLSLSPTGVPYSFRYLKSTIVRAEAVDTGTPRDPRKVVAREVVALVVALVAARLVAPETLTVLREQC
ncbi:hypothetical protein DYB26_014982 [Aphanomyces astaci]|uniref:Uncharacterized protein n=1 Tax=Aphanomyces astaci TaxID=112090 RepID=A0A397F2S0_APHAT|nr:hypothetical protein DYB26_014982 [Aphanomyces astaci]RHZ08506.1 hypothetical protein DYB31_015891 [Aphanomyces astaci]